MRIPTGLATGESCPAAARSSPSSCQLPTSAGTRPAGCCASTTEGSIEPETTPSAHAQAHAVRIERLNRFTVRTNMTVLGRRAEEDGRFGVRDAVRKLRLLNRENVGGPAPGFLAVGHEVAECARDDTPRADDEPVAIPAGFGSLHHAARKIDDDLAAIELVDRLQRVGTRITELDVQ